MDPKTYVENVLRTESSDWAAIERRLGDKRAVRLLHAAMGMTTESGEFVDALKKYVFYGRPLDGVNIMEEAGDLLWYVAVALDELGLSFELVMERNIEKLRKRYAAKFSEQEAHQRNLEQERAVLERATKMLGRVATPISDEPLSVPQPSADGVQECHMLGTTHFDDLRTSTLHQTVAVHIKEK
jgi:NTP pyrophosphatase (non-canonical NTP hydrolase)